MKRQIDVEKEKTLRYGWMIGVWAIIPSSVSLILGRSNTQLADLIRRSCETMALFLSWVAFKKGLKLEAQNSSLNYQKLESKIFLFFTQVIFLSVILVVYTSIHRVLYPKPLGNLALGVIVAFGDLAINGFFWKKNFSLYMIKPSIIMEAQWKLYRIKTTVNLFVLISLLFSMFLKGKIVTYVDASGAFFVAMFLGYSAFQMLTKSRKLLKASREQTNDIV